MRIVRHSTAPAHLGLVVGLLAAAYSVDAAQQVTFGSGSVATLPIEAPRHLGGSQYSTRFEDATWDHDAWTLTTTSLRPSDFRAVAFTANGYFGSSMASTGPFFQSFGQLSGWPVFDQRQTFGTVSGFFDRQAQTNGSNFPWLYEQGWDSVISGIPHWGPLILELEDGSYLAANTSTDELSNIQLVQDFKQGLARWQYTWSPKSQTNTSVNITYVAFADKLHVNRGFVYLQAISSSDCKATLYNILDGRNALRTTFKTSGSEGDIIYTAVNPNGVNNVTAWMYSTVTGSPDMAVASNNFTVDKPFIGHVPSTVVQTFNISLESGQPVYFVKHVGVASSDGFSDPQSQARNAVEGSVSENYSAILNSHIAEWQTVLPRGSVVDYTDPITGLLPTRPELIEKSIVSVVSAFTLLMNTISENALSMVGNAAIDVNGLSVCGLTSDCYGGQKFWDMDVWDHPHLSAVFPLASKQITNSRVHQYPQAKANVATAFTSSKNETFFSQDAAIYPWTSGRDANCTATGPCFDYEYHLNGDIIHSFVQQWTGSGDTVYLRDELYPIMQSVSAVFSDMLVKTGSSWQLMNMTDPDEYYNHVNDGAFTMPLIATVLNNTNTLAEYFGDQINSTWADQAQNIFIPTAGDLSLEFDSMNGSVVVKQADVILKIYPLNLMTNYSVTQKQADLNYYAGHQSPEGPGMTWAIFSIASNSISPSGCAAYTYDEYSWSPYVRAPWFVFSEQLIDDPNLNGGTNPAFPFLTGEGGFMQVDIFGYLGLRRELDWNLYIDPSLPPQIENLGYPTFFHHGWPIQARSNQTHTTLTRSGSPLSSANQTFMNSAINVVVKNAASSRKMGEIYPLRSGQSLSIPNRVYSANKTEPGNILQCQTVTSSATNVPGLFARAAIDGASSTIWQPQIASQPQSLTIDISNTPFSQLQYASFDWAQQPPIEASIVLHNYTDWSKGQWINISSIEISRPFDDQAQVKIVPYEGNTTKIEFNQTVWSSNYVSLVISGNQGNSSEDAPGATVAEFALVSQ